MITCVGLLVKLVWVISNTMLINEFTPESKQFFLGLNSRRSYDSFLFF